MENKHSGLPTKGFSSEMADLKKCTAAHIVFIRKKQIRLLAFLAYHFSRFGRCRFVYNFSAIYAMRSSNKRKNVAL